MKEDPFLKNAGLNAHRHELANSEGFETGGGGDLGSFGILGLVWLAAVSIAPVILPQIIVGYLLPSISTVGFNVLTLLGYLAIVYFVTRYNLLDGLPVLGSGGLMIVGSFMVYFLKPHDGSQLERITKPATMFVLGAASITYFYWRRRKYRTENQNDPID